MVEVDVDLYVSAFVEEILEQPVADLLVETLEETCTDGHDALEVFYLEGDGGDDFVEVGLLGSDFY